MLIVFWNVAAFIVTLGLLITIHEFGHFLIARRFGVHIERFSIGFGKTLWKYTDRYNTDFIVAMIPLGGYVKMLDESVDQAIPKMRHYAFSRKTISQRAAIIVAGPIANFLFAIFAYWIVFIVGAPTIRPIIGEIIPNSIAESAKLTPGMEIKSIDGIKTPDWDTVQLELANKIGSNNTTISVVSSPNSSQWQNKVLNLQSWTFKLEKEDLMTSLGIYPIKTKVEPILIKVQKNSAANKAGLKVGDKIIKINNQPVIKWITFVKMVQDNPGKLLLLEIERENNIFFINLIPDKKLSGYKIKGFAGVVPKVIPLSDEYKIIRHYEPLKAFLEANDKTWQLIKLTIKTLIKLISGDLKLKNLNGPILIAQGAGISAKSGMVHYLMFLALVSVNLGVMNLFPLPILDGGHLLFLVLEKFNGGLISKRVQELSYRISSILLMLLMGLALFNDLSRL